jgi:hypothetical protein
MFRKINRLIPVFEKWDFNKLFVNKDLYNFINKTVYPELQVTKKPIHKTIPYNKQWESRDFYRKNAK